MSPQNGNDGDDSFDTSLKRAAHDLAALHKKHYESRSPLQRFIEAIAARMAEPWFLLLCVALTLAWVAAHVFGALYPRAGLRPDQNWMQIALGFAAVLMTALILTGQRKDEDLAEERAEMMLHMVVLLDRKFSGSAAASPPIDVARAKQALDEAHADAFSPE